LEQYRHATRCPTLYWREALRRDPLDSRCNNAMGLLLYRRGRFEEAETYFRVAIRSLTRRNPNPYDGEAFYNLGLTLKMQERYDEAKDAFYKSTWNDAWQSAGFFELARLACRRGGHGEALELLERSLARNADHHRARHLKIAILRRLGRAKEARAEARNTLARDPLELGALNEQRLLGGPDEFRLRLCGNVSTAVEVALDYAQAGLFDEAIALLEEAAGPQPARRPRSAEREACPAHPMVHYYLGWVLLQKDDSAAARRAFARGATLPADYCFPNELECVLALTAAQRMNPRDARAPYYLGLFWYAHRRSSEAIASWERAARLDPPFPTVHRNLALAYYNKEGRPEKARRALEKAVVLDPTDARVLFERDQLDRRLGAAPRARLRRLERHATLVELRDDLSLERVTLMNVLGRHEEALRLLAKRRFHPWEGGEGRATGQYVKALLGIAHAQLEAGRFADALGMLERAREFPENLGEGKLPGARENDVLYFLGVAHAALGHEAESRESFRLAAQGATEPASTTYYNDAPPDLILYRGLAWRRLGRLRRAASIFRRLVDYGRRRLRDRVTIDYFAVSLPDFLVFEDDLTLRHRIHCHYMVGLGLLGFGRVAASRRQLERVLALDPSHVGAAMHLRLIKILKP
jgi:tetratricopeptide (TPR) repeat protein